MKKRICSIMLLIALLIPLSAQAVTPRKPKVIPYINFSGATGTEPYGVRLSGGSAHNLTITTENVPTGMYWIYVYNNGDYSVNGVVQYSVSE